MHIANQQNDSMCELWSIDYEEINSSITERNKGKKIIISASIIKWL
jgi:hypothetical protein